MKPHPTSLRIPDELKRKLKAYADARRWSFNKLIEYILEEWLKYQERKK